MEYTKYKIYENTNFSVLKYTHFCYYVNVVSANGLHWNLWRGERHLYQPDFGIRHTIAATSVKVEVWTKRKICLILHLSIYTNFCKPKSHKKANIAHSRNNWLLLLTRRFIFLLFHRGKFGNNCLQTTAKRLFYIFVLYLSNNCKIYVSYYLFLVALLHVSMFTYHPQGVHFLYTKVTK